MNNTGLFIVILVVVVLVIGLVVALLWPKEQPPQSSTTSDVQEPSPPNTSNDSLDLTDVTQPYGPTHHGFEKVFIELGNKQFELIEVINTERQGAVRAEISVLISRVASLICDAKKGKEFIESYNAKIDNLVRYVAISIEQEYNKSSFSASGSDEHTLTGTQTGTEGNNYNIRNQCELTTIKIQLSLLSSALAEAFGACLSVDGKDLVSLLNLMDAALISYNELYNIEHKLTEAQAFRKRHLGLWKKVHLS